MSNIFDEALKDIDEIKSYRVMGYNHYPIPTSDIIKALELGKLYKDFFDKLKIELRNTFDIDYLYPHEFIIGYDIKSENKELVELFKKIKELEK